MCHTLTHTQMERRLRQAVMHKARPQVGQRAARCNSIYLVPPLNAQDLAAATLGIERAVIAYGASAVHSVRG